jgi:hypothetical protein
MNRTIDGIESQFVLALQPIRRRTRSPEAPAPRHRPAALSVGLGRTIFDSDVMERDACLLGEGQPSPSDCLLGSS